MSVRVVQRVASYLKIGSRMIYAHIPAIAGLCKAVMSRTVDAEEEAFIRAMKRKKKKKRKGLGM